MATLRFITPCYNEEHNVEEVYNLVRNEMVKIGKYQYEHIFKVATTYGLKTEVIADQSDWRNQVRPVLDRPRSVCDVRVSPDEIRAPRLSSAQRPDGSFVSKPLEDLWPFLERQEFGSSMMIPPFED